MILQSGDCMATELDAYIDNLIAEKVEGLLHDDQYYEYYATPLKPATKIRDEDRENLKSQLQFREIREQMNLAQELIFELLPKKLAKEQFAKIEEEFKNASSHFTDFFQSPEDKSNRFSLQEAFGFSDDTVISIYELAQELTDAKQYKNASALFVFLEMLAPHVPNFWIGHAFCLQELSQHQEAIAVLTAAQILDPTNLSTYLYKIESYSELKENDKRKQEIDELNTQISRLDGEEREVWENKIKEL